MSEKFPDVGSAMEGKREDIPRIPDERNITLPEFSFGAVMGLEEEKTREATTKLIEQIQAASRSSFAVLLQDLRNYAHRDRLSDEVAEALLKKGYELWEESGERQEEREDRGWGLMSMLDGAIIGGVREGGDRAFVDAGFEAFVRLFDKHPAASEALWTGSGFSQNLHMIHPKLLLEGVANLLWRPSVSASFKRHVVDDINYLHAFHGGERFNNAVTEQLDFSDPDKYFKTGIFLEFLKQLHAVSGMWPFSDELYGPERIQAILEDAIERSQGSYLLNLRAREIVDLMTNSETMYSEDSTLPFLLTHQTFAFVQNNRVFTAPIEQFGGMQAKLAEFHQLEEEMLAYADEEGVVHDPVLTKKWRVLHRALFTSLTHELDISDLTINRPDKTEEQIEKDKQQLFDYRYMARFPIRNTIERKFGFCVADLLLREQYYFLQFIKSKNAEEIEPIKEFTQKFGLDGIRAFLAMEYNPELGQDIVELGRRLPEEQARALFARYAEILDNSQRLKDALKQGSEGGQEMMLHQRFADEVHEALVRRTIDTLLAVRALDADQKAHGLTLEDVDHALSGVAVFTKLMCALSDEDEDFALIKRQREGETFSFLFQSKKTDALYRLRCFVRSREEEVPMGRGNTVRAQARVNLELDFDTPKPDIVLKNAFGQRLRFKTRHEERRVSRLRIGIDRDTYTDPPLISLDMGRDRRDAATFERSGDPLGRLLTLASEMGHHNPKSFGPEFADADTFASIAEGVKEFLESRLNR